jgi:hypothetical protein
MHFLCPVYLAGSCLNIAHIDVITLPLLLHWLFVHPLLKQQNIWSGLLLYLDLPSDLLSVFMSWHCFLLASFYLSDAQLSTLIF